MRVVTKERGTASIFLDSDEMRPHNGLYLPELFNAVQGRYGFVKAPTPEEARAGGARFNTGRLLLGAKNFNIQELAIFNDGFSVTTTETADSEVVLDELFIWLREDFGFREPLSSIERNFKSELIVDFANSPERLFAALMPALVFAATEMGGKQPLFNGLRFTLPQSRDGTIPEFMFERRAGTLELKRYYCRANLRTASFVKALEMVDKQLA